MEKGVYKRRTTYCKEKKLYRKKLHKRKDYIE